MRTTRRQFLKNSAALAAASALTAQSRWGVANDSQTLDVGSEPQLLIDDWLVEKAAGLTRTLHQPSKQGLIKESDGSNWDRGDVYHGNIVCRDNAGKFHMIYRYHWWDGDLQSVIGDDRAHWYREDWAYATSDDGIRWEKPKLGLADGPTGFRQQNVFPFEVPTGISKDNNLGCPIDFIYDLHANGNIDDPDKRFLLRVMRREDNTAFAKVLEPQLYYAADWPDFARDPKWREKLTPIPGGTLSPRKFKTINGYDHAAREWFMVGQDTIANWVSRGGRDIARFATADLVHWSGPELVLPVAADESRRPDHWIEYMYLDAYRIGGRDNGAWLGQLLLFDSDRTNPQYEVPTIPNVWRKGVTDLRLVISRDAGKSWQRVCDKQIWLPHHAEERGYDRVLFGVPPTPVDDEIRFYYSAWDGDHLVFNKDGTTYYKDHTRLGRTALATLRRDGYVSLDAGDAIGELLTKPLRFSGDKLTVNLAAPQGTLRVELQDESGRPLEGFAAADCLPTTGDGAALSVRWRANPDLRKLADRPVRAKILLQNGSLYALKFG